MPPADARLARSVRLVLLALVAACIVALGPTAAPVAAAPGSLSGYALDYEVDARGELDAAYSRMLLRTELTITAPAAGLDRLLLGILPRGYDAWTDGVVLVDGLPALTSWTTKTGLALDLTAAPWAAGEIHTVVITGTIDWGRSTNTTGRLRRFGSGTATVLLAGDFLPLPVSAARWPVWSDPLDAATARRIRFTLQTAVPIRAAGVILAGERVAGPGSGNGTTWTHEIAPARSYALAIAPSPSFGMLGTSVAVKGVDGSATSVRVTAHGTSSTGRSADVAAAKRAVSNYALRFGAPPYRSLKIVNAGVGVSCAHEFPGMIFLCSAYTGAVRRHLVHHEAAHQWWYALVATDQRDDPWLDESLAEFSAQRSYAWTTPFRAGDCTMRIDGPSGPGYYPRPFGTQSYEECVYDRGANFWFTLGRTIGFTKLDACLKGYVGANRFRSPGPVTLVRTLIACDARVIRVLNPSVGVYPWLAPATVDAAQ